MDYYYLMFGRNFLKQMSKINIKKWAIMTTGIKWGLKTELNQYFE